MLVKSLEAENSGRLPVQREFSLLGSHVASVLHKPQESSAGLVASGSLKKDLGDDG